MQLPLMDGEMRPVVAVSASGRGPTAAQERDKITALEMERGRNAFQAIIDNQNSTEPRGGEEIESNGEGGEQKSRCSGNYMFCFGFGLLFFFLRGNKRKQEIVLLDQIAVTDLLYSGCLTLQCYRLRLNSRRKIAVLFINVRKNKNGSKAIHIPVMKLILKCN